MTELTAQRLRELMHYDPETGVFTRIRRSGIGAHNLDGAPAGTLKSSGYRDIRIDGCIYKAHRLAWLYMTGVWPDDMIDHADRERDNNAWANLREATRSQNNANRPACRSNRSGFKGVRKRGNGSYAAQIKKDGKVIHIGTFASPDLTHKAYQSASRMLHGNFARSA